jgi:hypothetical protein
VASTFPNTPEDPGETAEAPIRPGAAVPAAGHGHHDGEDATVVFAELAENGHFFRDSRMGRIFHPGKISLREVCSKDSLHVSVGAGNRVSVHVDRYSPVRVVIHNAGVVADLVLSTLRRRRGLQRCELECGRVWVDDEGVVEIVEEGCDDDPRPDRPQAAPAPAEGGRPTGA